jgi:hypothetical protein
MNIGAPWPGLIEARARVHAMQTKLHRWATDDPGRVCGTPLQPEPALSRGNAATEAAVQHNHVLDIQPFTWKST